MKRHGMNLRRLRGLALEYARVPRRTLKRMRGLVAKPFPMYDSVTIGEIPKDAPAVAGYVDGHYKTYPKLKAAFPKAHRLSIAVFAKDDAECLDVEKGDATNAQAPAWVKRQKTPKPVVYSSVSNWPSLLAGLKGAGIRRRQIRVWTAHYTYHPHRCTRKCDSRLPRLFKADATQWTDRANGKNLDESLCRGRFFG